MSDVGLGATLQLDIAEALGRIDALAAQLTSVTTDVPTSLADPDAAGITSAIDAAVDAADTGVTPEADADGVTGAIDAAIDAADGTVPVDADTATAEDQIAALGADTTATVDVDADTSAADDEIASTITNAESSDIVLSVTADTGQADAEIAGVGEAAAAAAGGVSGLGDATKGLSDDTASAAEEALGLATGVKALSVLQGVAAGSATGLGSALGGVSVGAAGAVGGVGAAVAVLDKFFQSGVKVQESKERFTQTFGALADGIRDVDVGTLNGDLADLALALGTSTSKLRDAGSDIGQFGAANGTAADEVARTAENVLALSLRARALNPALGESGDIASALQAGLARGGRALARFGIALTASEIQARALRDTGKSTNSELTQFDKLAAGAAIAAERLGPSLGGVVADGAEKASIQLDRMQVQFSRLAAEVGEPLVVPVLDLLTDLVPVGLAAGHVLGSIVESLTPLIELLGEAAPAFAFFGNVIARGIDLQLKPLTFVLDQIHNGVDRLFGPSGAEKFAAEVKRATDALTDENGVLDLSTEKIAEFIKTGSRFESQHQTDDLDRLGISLESVGELALKGAEGKREFDAAIREGGTESKNNIGDLNHSFDDLQKALQESSRLALALAVDQGSLTAAQRETAEATNRGTDGQVDYVAALNDARPAIDAHTAALDAATAKYGGQLAAAEALASAYSVLGVENRGLLSQFEAFAADGLDDTEIVRYTQALDRASLSEGGMSAAASLLGTNVATLQSLVGSLTGAVDSFADSALGGLPKVSDAYKPVEKAAKAAGGATRDLAKETRDAERAIRDAGHGIETANRATEDSLKAVADATDGVTKATQDLVDAQEAVLDAEKDLARLRAGASAQDLEEGELNIESARISSEEATLRVSDAEADLAKARDEDDAVAIRKAELDLESARIRARQSVFDVTDAEAALQDLRAKGTDQDQAVVDAQDRIVSAYAGVDDARAAVVEANEKVADAQRRVEDSAYAAAIAVERLSDAQEALANVGRGGGGGGGGSSEGPAQASLTQFIANLHTQAAEVRDFLADLDAIFAAGGEDLAATLATEGFEAGNAYADQLAASINPGGKSALVTSAEEAVDDHNRAISEADTFLREQFGPKYIATTGLVASLAQEAFGANLSFAQRTRIATNLAATTLDESGKAIALIAATEGREAADAYADLFNIDDKTVAAGLAAAKTLKEDKGRVVPAASGLGKSALFGFQNIFDGLQTVARGAVTDAATSVDRTTPTLTGAAVRAAGAAHGGFGGLIGDFSTTATDAVTGAAAAVDAATATVTNAAVRARGSAHSGFGGLLGDFTDVGGKAIDAASTELGKDQPLVNSLNATLGFVKVAGISQALGAGIGVGEAFSTGVAAGIGDAAAVQKVKDAAAKIVRDAETAARATAKSKSPSQLFAALGRDLGLGTALGLQQSAVDVVSEAEAIVRAAAAAVGAGDLGAIRGGAVGAADVVGFVNGLAPPGAGDDGFSVVVNLGGVRFDGAISTEQAARVTSAAVDAAMASASEKAKALRVLAVAQRAQGPR